MNDIFAVYTSMDTDIHHGNLKKHTVISTLSLFFQSGYSALLGLVANLVLTIIVSPAIFGIYITVLSIMAVFNYFSDIGLAASLVQKKEVSDDDVKTTFTVQQILIISVISVGFFLTKPIQAFYNLPHDGIYLYWALLIAFFISSLKTIPSIFLERKIQFQKIVFVQIVENTLFYVTVSVLAVLRFGLQSFTFAVLIRSVVGLVVMYALSFWIPKIGISIKSLKTLLSFGLPFQANSFLALIKDDLMTLFLGKIIGFTGLGYIGWAKKWAEAPIRIIMDNISRVLFPVLSRLQHDKEKVSRLIEKILYYQTILLAPALLGLTVIMPILVQIIPKYNKWTPALPFFYLFVISAFLSSYSSPFTNLFNALGKVNISFAFMILWTVLTWVLTPILTNIYGYYGFPVTQVILSLFFVLVVIKARALIHFRFVLSIYRPILSAFGMFFILFLSARVLHTSFITFLVLAVTGGISYLAILYLLFKINLMTEIAALFKYEK